MNQTCETCRWGVESEDFIEEELRDIDCHYEPHDISHSPTWWCGKWQNKTNWVSVEESNRKFLENVEAWRLGKEGEII